jgi:adenylate cyclase
MRAKSKQGSLFVIIFIASILFSFLYLAGLFSNLQQGLSTGLYGGLTPREDIAIIAWPWDRAVFADLIKKLDNAKVLGIDVAFFEYSNNKSDSALIDAVNEAGNVIIPVEYTSYAKEGNQVVGKGTLFPIKGLDKAALGLGYINILTDSDGMSRAVNVNVKGDYESFATEVYKKYTSKDYKAGSSRFLINFVGAPGSFATYSFSDVLSGKVNVSIFKDKIVLIGATAPDLHDAYFVPTSYGKAMPGVEIHANTLQSMIEGKELHNENSILVIISIFVAVFLIAFLVSKYNPWIVFGISFVLIIVNTLLGIYLFNKNIILNLFYVPFSLIIGYSLSLIYFFIIERKEKKHIMDAFSKYVSPVLVKEIMKEPEQLKLGGDKKELTILFSDIRGFTSLSEKMKPEELVHLLNEYLSDMTKIIMEQRGLVDKFIGDAIMAFWGAPLKEKKHADLACESALGMKAKLEELNKKWSKEGLPYLKIGIGIHTGKAVVGNIGSEERFDYTAIGDDVNLSSRLEGVTKQYDVYILISEFTLNELSKEFIVRELDHVTVKGKNHPIKIYEVLGKEGKISKELLEIKEHFEEGLELYKKQKWDDAIKAFHKSLNLGDKTSKIFIERCEEFKKNPPVKDWDGVWNLKEK